MNLHHARLIAIATSATLLLSACGGGGTADSSTGASNGSGGVQEQVLYNFAGSGDGANPQTGVIVDSAGDLYGAAYTGGAGYGTLFEVKPNGNGGYGESTIYSFAGGSDGANPPGPLTMDRAGNLYGTSTNGGISGDGTVYELTPNGSGYTKSIIHDFGGNGDGAFPYAGLIMDGSGILYGTTDEGGQFGYGSVFKLVPNGTGGYTESIVYSFDGSTGQNPRIDLVMDSAGNLYGATYGGGGNGAGVVFKLTPNGVGGYAESTIYNFIGANDGANPSALIIDSAGDVFGSTFRGGSNGYGTIFELTPNGSGAYAESTVYSFSGGGDGANPQEGLLLDNSGNLYGTTANGGSAGDGTVFELTLNGNGSYSESVVYSFTGLDGGSPSGLIMDSGGNLYGTTFNGGSFSNGTVFKISLP